MIKFRNKFLQISTFWNDIQAMAEATRIQTVERDLAVALEKRTVEICLDREGAGTVQSGPLNHVIQAARSERSSDLLLLGTEADELRFVHWMP